MTRSPTVKRTQHHSLRPSAGGEGKRQRRGDYVNRLVVGPLSSRGTQNVHLRCTVET
jgi:uncharacterized membrane protein affecting hemolysin expression